MYSEVFSGIPRMNSCSNIIPGTIGRNQGGTLEGILQEIVGGITLSDLGTYGRIPFGAPGVVL